MFLKIYLPTNVRKDFSFLQLAVQLQERFKKTKNDIRFAVLNVR